ncbi:MAG: hypothetical protein ETSY2_42490 [Candidatus Entotheonella gemina]|uniref:Uncharacterized protein n=2 Tax=Candidatus Entotheonella TaxID=93171 RepID=W4LKY1_9BACT|nr:MAG: hypothetical protein ETSY2_42490 [Candidatus Entotheonella gemina]
MHFSFNNTTPQVVIQRMIKELKNRKLERMVNFDLTESKLIVTIRKLGCSRLVFDVKSDASGHEFSLRERHIVLTHRPFRVEVEKLIQEVVDDLGGQVTT